MKNEALNVDQLNGVLFGAAAWQYPASCLIHSTTSLLTISSIYWLIQFSGSFFVNSVIAIMYNQRLYTRETSLHFHQIDNTIYKVAKIYWLI
jgi:hypothetical protein